MKGKVAMSMISGIITQTQAEYFIIWHGVQRTFIFTIYYHLVWHKHTYTTIFTKENMFNPGSVYHWFILMCFVIKTNKSGLLIKILQQSV